jgi:co-chaperonin GroES (HSP10)
LNKAKRNTTEKRNIGIKIMIIKPVQNKVLISAQQSDKVTSTGIVLRVSLDPDMGKVEAIGPDVREVAVGDTVFLDWNQAEKLPETDFWVIKEDHIIFIKD